MNPTTLLIVVGLIAAAFIITYGASRIAFMVKKPADMLWAGMLCAAGLLWPMMLAANYAATIVAPPMVAVVLLLAALASLGAHLLALRKLK